MPNRRRVAVLPPDGPAPDSLGRSLRLPLSSFGAILLIVLAFGIAAGYAWVCVRHYRATRWANSVDPTAFEEAVRLEPSNAEYLAKLALFRSYSADGTRVAERDMEAAARLNPYSAPIWLQLAGLYLRSDNLEKHRDALDKAARYAPTVPDTTWQVANYWLIDGQTDKALRAIRVVLTYEPSRISLGVEDSWNATRDISRVLNQALPPTVPAYTALLSLMSERSQMNEAQVVWSRLMALPEAVPPTKVFPYFDLLLSQQRSSEAERDWKLLMQRNGIAPGAKNELVTDGGFEADSFSTGGFYWQLNAPAQIQPSFDTDNAHSGSRSLLITFDQAKASDAGLMQVVPVEANGTYLLKVFAQSDQLMSAAGPKVAIVDHATHEVLGATDEISGTTPWRELRARVATKPSTTAIEIRVLRSSDGLIDGKLRLDDVSLVKE